jgi:ribosomal protein S18 acetylase RimI-like enzyme
MNQKSLTIRNTQSSDLPLIFHLFDQSIQYQEKHGYPVWKNYDQNAIKKDIEAGNQYKILVNDRIAIVFSVAYSDKIIWRAMDTGESVYLHRIVVNPEFKGQKLFGAIVDWAVQHCKEMGLKSIRMDTWAANANIIKYYKSFGFRVVENYTTPDCNELPVHNRKLALTLMELAVPH